MNFVIYFFIFTYFINNMYMVDWMCFDEKYFSNGILSNMSERVIKNLVKY